MIDRSANDGEAKSDIHGRFEGFVKDRDSTPINVWSAQKRAHVIKIQTLK